MKINITGSSGFVGQNLIPYLEKEGINISLTLRKDFLSIEPELFKNNNAIVHLAGKAHDLRRISNPDEYYQANFELTKKLYDAFIESDAKKFIFISSVKAVADAVDSILTEETTSNPKTYYGKSKLMAEDYIQNQSLPKGKSYFILRPCMIHGPGNKGNLNLLFKFVQNGLPYPLASFENRRSFLSVENLCYVILNLLNNDIPSGVYHVADDEPLSTNDVVNILADSIGKKAKLWKIPIDIIKGLATLGEILRLPLNTERLNKLTENYVVSNKRIKSVLGISLPLSAKEGLRLTADSFLK